MKQTAEESRPTTRSASRRRWLFVPILALFGTLAALVVFELVLRAVDPNYYGEIDARQRFIVGIRDETPPGRRPLTSFYMKPGADVEFLGARFEINANGYRTPVRPTTKPADTYRIAVVGDSVAFGWGIPEPDCFPRLLETLLNARERPFGRAKVEVLNFSGPGRGLGDYYIVLEDEALRYDPDLVLVPFIFNDVPLEAVDTGKEPPPLPRTPPQWLASSYAVRFAYDVLNRFGGAAPKSEYWIGIRSTPEALKLSCYAFAEMQKKIAARPEPPRFVIFDTVGERPDEPIPEIAACTERLGIPRIECFLPVADWDEWCIEPPVHTHPSVRAHRVYAETILAWLEKAGWLD